MTDDLSEIVYSQWTRVQELRVYVELVEKDLAQAREDLAHEEETLRRNVVRATGDALGVSASYLSQVWAFAADDPNNPPDETLRITVSGRIPYPEIRTGTLQSRTLYKAYNGWEGEFPPPTPGQDTAMRVLGLTLKFQYVWLNPVTNRYIADQDARVFGLRSR